MVKNIKFSVRPEIETKSIHQEKERAELPLELRERIIVTSESDKEKSQKDSG